MANKSLLDQVREHIEHLKSRRSAVMSERGQLEQRREELLAMPIPKADVLAFATSYIDLQSDFFMSSGVLAKFIGKMAKPSAATYRQDRGPTTLRDFDRALSGGDGLGAIFGIRAWPLPFSGDEDNSLPSINRAACFYLGDAIKEKIAQHFDSLYEAPQGIEEDLLPISERRKELAAIADRIAEVDAEIGGIDDELGEVRASTDTTTAERRAAQSIAIRIDDFRAKARDIYAAYDGTNADELAGEFRMSASQIKGIGTRSSPDFSDQEARKILGI